MTDGLKFFYSLDKITKIRNHFWRAAGKIDNWDVCLCKPIDDPVDCVARHDLLPLWPRVHVTMHAGEIAKLAHVDLKNFGTSTTQRQRVLHQFLRKPIHSKSAATT